MPKAPSKQQNKKKRDKRRLLQQAASSPRAWESLDLSSWLDNRVGLCLYTEGTFILKDNVNGTSMPIYPNVLPGMCFFSCWAHEHPDDERETDAVVLIKQILRSDGAAAENANPGRKKPLLNKLEKMAGDGCVTASSFLGWCFATGNHVRKNLAKGEKYLRFACDNNEPAACFHYATCLGILAPKELDASCAANCPNALQLRAKQFCDGHIELDSGELDSLACSLAAFAFKGSWACLDTLALLLDTKRAAQLRKKYAFAILSLLEKLAAAGFVPAMEALGKDHLYCTLGPKKEEKGLQLLLRARSLGSDLAGTLYAGYMLDQLKKPGVSMEEQQKGTLAVLKILEEDHLKGLGFPYVDEKLALLYISSSSETSFQKAMQLIENCIARGYFDIERYLLSIVLTYSDNKERHKRALRLLNVLVRKKDTDATFMRARYYLEGRYAVKHDMGKGLSMMHQAAEMGSGEACFFLAETYLFGLFKCEADIEKAEDMAKKGIWLDNYDCETLLSLILFGEFQTDKTAAETDEDDPFALFMRNFDTRKDYYDVTWNLVINDASKPLSDLDLDDLFGDDAANEGQFEYNADELAERCLSRMSDCKLGTVAFIAHALKKIARTPHAGLYAATFAEKLSLLPDISCDSVARYLQTFIDKAPESARKFRPQSDPTLILP